MEMVCTTVTCTPPPPPQVASQVGALDVGYTGAGVGDLSGVRLLYLLGAVSGAGGGVGGGRTHPHIGRLCRMLGQ